ncbi:GNAT family N-acetyltransferase [Peribacillus sp. B-H-3]|uniref:GNAT family N-acetyltransferase n=1 Tax=Peribacillus sp. B-H-3 TaxID=3400420 RepID=UPI003B01C430
MIVKQADSQAEMKDAYSVRTKVFIHEQNVPAEEEIDQYEEEAKHFVLYDDHGSPIGAGRFRLVDGMGKVERICVLSDVRSKGAGTMLMTAIHDEAKKQNIHELKLNAQNHAIPFYEKLGYQVVSEEFLDAGIPHHTMKMKI